MHKKMPLNLAFDNIAVNKTGNVDLIINLQTKETFARAIFKTVSCPLFT